MRKPKRANTEQQDLINRLLEGNRRLMAQMTEQQRRDEQTVMELQRKQGALLRKLMGR